ncbi:MAG TPA: RNA polymerase subunit sigma-24 [Clostridiales bacterium]|nr:RNA polymerase subunit sigma-24 [Clostridiales bacterium]
MARAVAGDGDAFAELVEPYESRVYNLAVRMCGDRETAFDLAQEVFLKAYRFLPRFKGEASFSTWLYRVASNTCLDQLRRRRRSPETLSLDDAVETGSGSLRRTVADSSLEPERLVLREEVRAEIRDAVTGLPLEQRLAVLLRDFEGLTYGEIAEALGCSLGTVKSRINRGRAALRERLTARELLPAAGVYSVGRSPRSSRERDRRSGLEAPGGRAAGHGTGPTRGVDG